MHLSILTPQGRSFEGEVESIKVPGTLGPMQILKNHAPILSSLGKGALSYQSQEGERSIQIKGGIFEFSQNRAVVLADFIES